MAVALCPRCFQPKFLPPGYTGALCDCAGRPLLPSSQAPAAAPSPASTQGQGAPLGRSEGSKDGGRGQAEGPSGSPGRGSEKGPQRPPQGQGGPIEAADKPQGLDGDWKPNRDLLEKADAWFATKFFKKGGIGDNDWKPLVAACKTWGMPKDAKWRDYLKEQYDTARANAVRILITAKAIDAPLPTESVTGIAGLVLKELDGSPQRDFTPDDLVASVKNPLGGASTKKEIEEALDKIVDAGLAWQPLIGRYKSMKGAK